MKIEITYPKNLTELLALTPSPDSWVYVGDPGALLTDDLQQALSEVLAENPAVSLVFLSKTAQTAGPELFEKLLKGDAGSACPFVFRSTYLKLAALKERGIEEATAAEELLFWLLEGGVRSEALALAEPQAETDPLPSRLHAQLRLSSELQHATSERLPFIKKNRPPDRFSYYSAFWISDDGEKVLKLHRDPSYQPAFVEKNPVLRGPLPHAANYYESGKLDMASGDGLRWFALEYFAEIPNLSHAIAQGIQSREKTRPCFAKACELFLSFLEHEVVPFDLSLSNAAQVSEDSLRFFDLEQIALSPAGPIAGRRGVFNLLAIAYYLYLDSVSEEAKQLRYDAFRLNCFEPLWRYDEERWTFEVDHNSAPPELRQLFEEALNYRDLDALSKSVKTLQAKFKKDTRACFKNCLKNFQIKSISKALAFAS